MDNFFKNAANAYYVYVEPCDNIVAVQWVSLTYTMQYLALFYMNVVYEYINWMLIAFIILYIV